MAAASRRHRRVDQIVTAQRNEPDLPVPPHSPDSEATRRAGESWPLDNARVQDWLDAAEADADRRGLRELKPALRLIAQATVALRTADWNTLVLASDD